MLRCAKIFSVLVSYAPKTLILDCRCRVYIPVKTVWFISHIASRAQPRYGFWKSRLP